MAGRNPAASAPFCPICFPCLQGLAALLVQGLSGCTPAEIVGVPADFITQLGLQQSLTPSRNNGFLNMFRLMQKKALDIYMQQQQGGSGSAADSPSSREEEGAAAIEQQDSSSGNEAAAEAERFSAAAALASNTPVADSMRRKLAEELQPLKLDLVDNSHQHAGHSGGCPQKVLHACGGCSSAAQRCIWQCCTGLLWKADWIPALPVTTSNCPPIRPPLFCPPSSIPAGHRGSASYSGETHFNLELVSPRFEGLTSIKRHRLVYQILEQEMRSPVHALSLITKTPAEAGMA
jgi:stress-induced morphogen